MKLALACVVAIGVAIGVSLPAASPRAAPPPAPVAAAVEESPRETVLDRSPGGHFYAVAHVNGEPIRFIVDTGASTIAFSEADAKRARIPFDRGGFTPVGRGASGVVNGQEVTVGEITLDGKKGEDLRGIVMEGADMSLLGQNYLRRLDVRIKGDTMTLR